MKELLKILVVLTEYMFLAPLLGVIISRSRALQRAALAFLVIMPAWAPNKLTLMLNSIELYRGHTKGFEASLIDVVAIGLIVSSWLNRGTNDGRAAYKWLPPGIWIYLLYCGLSTLSLFECYTSLYVFMGVFKFTKAALIFMGAFHALRDQEDLKWVLRALAGTLIFYAIMGLYSRFFEGVWQVRGWFEHQNPMAMWTYMIGLPLLAMAMYPGTSKRDVVIYMAGYAAGALLILLSVSRAGLAAYAGGSAIIALFCLAHGITPRLLGVTTISLVGAVVAAVFALDGMLARVKETRESREAYEFDLRDALNMQSKAMLKDHALGVGWNNFGIANSRPDGIYSEILEQWDTARGFMVYEENYMANPLTESLYWLLLAETGYPGFIGFVLFELLTLYWGLRVTMRFWKSPTGWFVGAVFIVLLITYQHSLVERILTQTKNMSMWMMFCGFLARYQYCRLKKRDLPFPSK